MVARTPPGALSVVAALTLVGCGDSGPTPEATVEVPEDHPCPEIALAPAEAELWEDAVDGEPVPLALVIPLESGTEAPVSQGNEQLPTHVGPMAWAWDLEVPEGTPVTAAAPGVIVWVRDDSTTSGTEAENVDDANWVVVDHGGGLFSTYVHLDAGSAVVVPGQVVSAGEVLAATGLSGLLGAPHLHFHVENTWGDSLAARFVEAQAPYACDRQPARDESVTREAAVAASLVAEGEVSALPADTFALFGVPHVTGLPARMMERGETYAIDGEAEAGFDTVWLLLFPEGGGDALLALEMPVADGGFSGALSVADLPAGRYGWAMAAANGTDVFADVAVRLTVID